MDWKMGKYLPKRSYHKKEDIEKIHSTRFVVKTKEEKKRELSGATFPVFLLDFTRYLCDSFPIFGAGWSAI